MKNKTYIVMWKLDNELKLNTFKTRREARQYKNFFDKDKKARITKVNFTFVKW